MAAIAASPESDSVFTANCDGEIKEWGAKDGGFRQMTVATVSEGEKYNYRAILNPTKSGIENCDPFCRV